LGGLGTKEGAGVLYAWAPPSFIPSLVPWLGILLLLLLRANRSAQAWLIWLPLVAVVLLRSAVRPVLDFAPSEVVGVFSDAIDALAFGVAALWLAGQPFSRWHRLVGFLGILGILAVAGIACVIVGQASDSTWETVLPTAFLVTFSVLVVSVALSLAGLCCRRRYRPAALFLWLMLWLPAVSVMLAAPFFVFGMVVSGGEAPWGEFIAGILLLAAVCLATLTPFLVLSSANAFFKGRLRALLRLGQIEGPPMLVPAPTVSPQTDASVGQFPASSGASPLQPPTPGDPGVGS